MNNGYAKLDIWRLEESGSWEVERVSEHAQGREEKEGIAAKQIVVKVQWKVFPGDI